MDQAIFPGHFQDYPDDEVALQRELEIGEAIANIYIDESFPPNARSLYFDPLNPPKGSIPNASIKWFSICEGNLQRCEEPTPFFDDMSSPYIKQGALGNAYFINALSLLACQSKFITRTMVSFKYASKGLYTFKFYKAGKWRYVHIDDYIPCRQSGSIHFSRNLNPNETFAMLYEKAYAKLHGCYEAISYGLVEKVLQEITPAAGVQTLRLERIPTNNVCDTVWEVLEKGTSTGALIGCGRFVEDPVSDHPALQQGITVGKMYQVVDICIATADPTEDFDALTVGMICIRNLQHRSGRFNGRWSYGHRLWIDYKEIAVDLQQRTRDLQHKRGLGPHPTATDDPRMDARNIQLNFKDDNEYPDDEPDTLDVTYIERNSATKIVQPIADDLYWIQIEDFVEIFNRVYAVSDLTFEKKGSTKRFLSKWLPGDFLVGSGGPPVTVSKELVEGVEKNEEDGAEEPEPEPKYTRVASVNDNFTDNPMFPFGVSEPTRVAITLYQLDKRWNIGRMGEDPKQVAAKQFISRKQRLESVMEYPTGIGFVLVRLSGLKLRMTEFKLKKVVGSSEGVAFSQTTTAYFHLLPGRYAVIPFTHTVLDRTMDYALHFQFVSNQVEFEIEDPIIQRLVDKDPSEEGMDEGNEPEDNDLLRVHENDDDVSIMSYEKEVEEGDDLDDEDDEDDDEDHEGSQRRITQKMVALPKLLLYKKWEYVEDIEELSIVHLYGEVGDMMKYIKSLKGEIRKLNTSIRTLTNTGVAEEQKAGGGPPMPLQAAASSSKLLSTSKRY